MTVLNKARMLARRAGIEIRRWPEGEVGLDRVRLLRHHGIETVLDVGANDGGYARPLREFGYTGRIVSFEPLAAPRSRLLARGTDPNWIVESYGLADFDGEIEIHIAGNNELSSSALPMLAAHSAAAPDANYVGVEKCSVHRLDSIWDEAAKGPTFLKMDVQGFERAVLDGAAGVIDQVVGVQIEVSFIPLYEGGMLWDEALRRLGDAGFTVMRIDPGFRDASTGRVFQSDAILFRQ